MPQRPALFMMTVMQLVSSINIFIMVSAWDSGQDPLVLVGYAISSITGKPLEKRPGPVVVLLKSVVLTPFIHALTPG